MTLAPPPVAPEPSDETMDVAQSQRLVTRQIRGSSLLLAGRIGSMVANLGVQVLLVRSLAKADFGMFAYALSLVTMGATFITLGLDRGLARFVAIFEERGEIGRLWGAIVLQLITIVGLGTAVSVVVIGFDEWVGRSLVDDERLGSLLAVMVLLAPLQALDSMAASLFAAFSESRAIFIRRYLFAPGMRLLVVGLLVLQGGSVFFLGAGYVLAGVFGVVIYGGLLVRTLRARGLLKNRAERARIDLPIAEVGAFTLPLLFTDAMFMVLNTSDVVILGRHAGTTAVSSYRAILPLARLNQMVMNSFSLLFAPLMARMWARGRGHEMGEAYWQTAAWVAVLTFPLFAATIGLAEPLTILLFGEQYSDAVPYLRILATAYYFNAALGFNGVTLKMIGRVWLSAAIAGAALVFNLAANLVLIPPYGAMGATLGTGATIVGYNLLKQWALRRGSGIRFFEPRYAALYTAIAAGTAAVWAIELAQMMVAVRVGVTALVVATVLYTGRRLLMVGELFPELRKVPLFGRLLDDAEVRS